MILKSLIKTTSLVVAVLLFSTLTGCQKFLFKRAMAELQNVEIFTVSSDKESVILEGIINSSALEKLKAIVEEHPQINTINIKNCDGSIDDEVNLKLGKYIYDTGMNTHLMDDGWVASGGTDLFLAGKTRTRGSNTKFGVHSWSEMTDKGKMVTAKDFSPEHESHQPYIKYYESIGFTAQEAKDFYFFTINLASAEDMHWMAEAEIEKYKMLQQ